MEKLVSENAVIADALEKLGGVEKVDLSDATTAAIVLPSGKRVESLKQWRDEYLPAPDRKIGTSEHTTIDSFIAHVNRQKLPHSVVFVDVGEPTLHAVYDYNEPGTGSAHFGDHCAKYDFQHSDAWREWVGIAGSWVSQDQLQGFLAERITDVVVRDEDIDDFAHELGVNIATPAQLIELSRNLRLTVKQTVQSEQINTSGECALVFTSQHQNDQGAPVKVPDAFVIQVPVFDRDAHYRIPCRLAYRIDNSRPVFKIAIPKLKIVKQDAIDRSVERVREECALPVFYGSPE